MEEFRVKGNEKFKAGDFAGAVEDYEKGLAAASTATTSQSDNKEEKLKLLGNISTCQRKLKQPSKAIDAATKAITEIDILAIKPRILRSVIAAEEGMTNDLPRALADAALAVLVDPSASVRQQIEGPVLHWAGKELLKQKKAILASSNNINNNNSDSLTKVARSRDNDLGLFATQAIPLVHTVVAGGGTAAVAKYPFSVGIYAESFHPTVMKATNKMAKDAAAEIDDDNNNNQHDDDDDDDDEQNNARKSTHEEDEDEPTKVCLSCGRCAAVVEKLFPCRECNGIAAFCADCTNSKRPGVQRHLKYECPRIQKLAAVYKIAEDEEREGSDELLEIGFHIITTIAAMHQQQDDGLTADWRSSSSILALKGNSDVLLPHANVMDILHAAFDDDKEFVGEKQDNLIDRIAAICLCNSFQVSDESGLPTCQVLFDSILSRVNHSCMPNCEFDSSLRCARTIRPIQQGEELCISYIANLHYPTDLRREQIISRFCFKCECPRCSNNNNNNNSKNNHLDAIVTASRPGVNGALAVSNSAKVVTNVVEFARAREPDEVAPELLQDLQQVKQKLGLELHFTHYLIQDLRNATTFCASALDNKELVKQSCFEEWMLWEALFPTLALPVKRDKIKNYILACCGVSEDQPEWLMNWLAFYDASA